VRTRLPLHTDLAPPAIFSVPHLGDLKMRSPTFLWTLVIGILSHVALGQDDFRAQLQNASAQGDVQALSQTFKRLQQAHPSDWQTTLNACFDLPQECATDSAPQWCSAFNQVNLTLLISTLIARYAVGMRSLSWAPYTQFPCSPAAHAHPFLSSKFWAPGVYL